MKKSIFLSLALLLSLCSWSQLDRSQRPGPAPAKPLEFGDYDLFELKNGLQIIVVENHKLPRVTMSLIVDNMPIKEGDKAGYVGLTGELLRQGTLNRSKDELDEEIDFMGASLFTGSGSVFVSGLSKYTERLAELMADVALNPAFPEAEFEKLKKQSLSGIESAKESPDALSSRLFNRTVYSADHPYGELETEATINNITLDDCREYYQKQWAPNRTYLAVVGDIKPKTAKKLINKYFGDWEPKEVEQPTYPMPSEPSGAVVNIINRSSASQTVLELGNTIDLQPGAEDVVKLRLANQILGGGSLGRLFKNIREDKGYTYGAYSGYDEDRLVGEFSASASVRNEVTDSAVAEFIKEFENLRNTPVEAEELQNAKNYITGSFGRSLERPQTIANFALNIERYGLPKDYYENYLQRLDLLTAEDVMKTAQKYIKTDALVITAVGKASEIADKLEKFGPVSYYNFEGEEVGPPSLPVPEGMTAQKVIDAYIQAIGGEEALNKVQDLTMEMKAEIEGMPPSMEASATFKRLRPGYFLNEIKIAGMGTVQKQVYNGDSAWVSGMQGTQKMEGDDLEEAKRDGIFFIEGQYDDLSYTLSLAAVEMVEGEKAYVVEVSTPEGEKTTEYYSVESGLKLMESQSQETPQGEVTSISYYRDYRAVNGVLFPHELVFAGGQKIKMTVQELTINTGLKKADFN